MTIHPALAIPIADIHALIAKATALLAKPSRGDAAWLDLINAVDRIEGNATLAALIRELEYDLSETETECLACSQSSCDCDARHDDRSAWGLTLPSNGVGSIWL